MASVADCDIIIRLDANHSKGMGHLYRMLQVAEGLKNRKRSVCFTGRINNASRRMLTDSRYRVIAFDDTTPEKEIIEQTFKEWNNPSLWLYDILDTQPEWIHMVQDQRIRIMCIDDCGAGIANADEVILMLPCKFMHLEPARLSSNVKYGIKYMILPPELDRYSRSRKPSAKQSFRIGVSMGGSDTHGSTVRIAEALNRTVGNITSVDFYTGLSFRHHRELAAVVQQAAYPGVIHKNVPNLHQQLDMLDIVITGGGMTLFETARMGLPILAFANESFEKDNIRYLADRKACMDLGSINEMSSRELYLTLCEFISTHNRFAEMSQNARELMIFSGRTYILNRIEAYCRV